MTVTSTRIKRAILLVSGTVLILIGSAITVMPETFYASSQISIGESINLLNELKAPAILLLVSGAFLITALFTGRRMNTALGLGALIYLSYAVSRLLSMVVDGAPESSLLTAAAIEAVLGMACLLALRQQLRRSN